MKNSIILALAGFLLLTGCGGGGSNPPPPAISVTVTPASPTVHVTGTQQFSAVVHNSTNQAVTWAVSGSGCTGTACGSINATGLYTAPASVPSPSTVTVTATAQADTTKSAGVSTTIMPAVKVTVSPVSPNVRLGKTQQFSVTVQNALNSSVTWSVVGTGCSGSACGAIDTNGLYTAPASLPSPATVTITATSVEDATKSDAAVAMIFPAIVVSVSPVSPSVLLAGTQQFTATVQHSISNSAVTWTVTGTGCSGAACGTVNSSGLYTAPVPVPVPNSITVTATSQEDATAAGTAQATITSNIALNVWPNKAQVPATATRQFVPALTGWGDTSVNWSVSCTGGTGSAACGSVDSHGVFTAPSTSASAGTVSVRVSSNSDPNKSASAIVAVNSSYNAILKGQYAYLYRGFWAGYAGQANATLTFDGAGNISSGVSDNVISGSPGYNVQNVSLTGTYYLNSDGRGSLTLFSPTGSMTYRFSVNAAGDTLYMQPFSNTDIRATVVMRKQDSTAFNNAAITGDYVFQFVGVDLNGTRLASLGRLHADGKGNITSGTYDMNDGTKWIQDLSLSGTYAVASNGRGTMQFTVVTYGTFHYSFYVVGSDRLYLISLDTPAANVPMLAGEALLQTGAPYSNKSLTGTAVLNLIGRPSATTARTTIGLATADGNGKISGILDENDAGVNIVGVAYTATYTIDAAGRGTLASSTLPGTVFYLSAPNTAFLMETPGSAVRTGSLEPQFALNYTPAHFLGAYAGATVAPPLPNSVTVTQVVSYDGVANDLDHEDACSPNDFYADSVLSGTFALSANGRSIISVPGQGIVAAQYLVSPGKYWEILYLIPVTPPENKTVLGVAEQ